MSEFEVSFYPLPFVLESLNLAEIVNNSVALKQQLFLDKKLKLICLP